MIKEHLCYLASNYKIIVPGEKIDFFKINICLTFDDAFYDFYYYVYPLLKKLKIKAVLAVPTKNILATTSVSPKRRLKALPHEIDKAPYCTWTEINEMKQSKHVIIASHSHSHKNLTSEIDLQKEIVQSKEILKKQNIDSNIFVYPYGKFNKETHHLTKENYKYIFRIGSAFNVTWNNLSQITYRIPCDNLKVVDQPLKLSNFFKYFYQYFLNSIRFR
jgi:peptidoglycan/xylan/chitin deacetylase (PgdA/CDA1 family)